MIGRITPGGAITEFSLPSGSYPWGITAGPDGNLWFTELSGNNIARITTAGVITEFPVPTPGSAPSGITRGPDGNLWFAEGGASKIVKVIVIVDSLGPITSNVSISPNPVAVNTIAALSATVDDATTGGSNVASAYYSINAVGPTQMLLTPSTAVTTQATATLAPFAQSNIYNVCVHGTDVPGNTGADACVLVPVYDPNGGFVTGSGQITSPAGADLLNASTAGPATFAFVSKYVSGNSSPTGNLQFKFKSGNLDFQSISMDWLVVTGQPRAIFRGTGTVNGTNLCNFEVDAWDGSFSGDDAFDLKITSCAGGGDRYNLPATAVTKGNIIIHK